MLIPYAISTPQTAEFCKRLKVFPIFHSLYSVYAAIPMAKAFR
jgi:hypothetical protein